MLQLDRGEYGFSYLMGGPAGTQNIPNNILKKIYENVVLKLQNCQQQSSKMEPKRGVWSGSERVSERGLGKKQIKYRIRTLFVMFQAHRASHQIADFVPFGHQSFRWTINTELLERHCGELLSVAGEGTRYPAQNTVHCCEQELHQ